MSVIDENKMKLLKMKERLLEVSFNGNRNTILVDYKKIVYEIDSELYKSITDKIKNSSDYADYPLERQLEILLDIENEYNTYYKFQENVRNICKKCNNSSVNLCDISIINIDEIRKRIDSIKRYLENVKKIEKNKEELDRLNNELISEDKKTNVFKSRINELDEDLRQSILRNEGRIYNSSGEIEYANVILEAESLGIDLKKMLNDEDMLQQALEDALSELNEVDERLKTAQICYNKRPDMNYKDIYLTIREETIFKKYRFIFLEIISLIARYDSSYNGAKEKRSELSNLIKSRIELLKQLNIKYLYDPFDRIGISEQQEVIDAYGDNSNKIKEIVDEINKISSDNDKRVSENREFADYFKNKIDLIQDNTPLANILDRESINLDTIEDDDKSKKVGFDNQVVRVSNLSLNFMLDRSLKKAHGVIIRVYEMINESSNTDDKSKSDSYSVTPQLVIEPVTSTDSVTFDSNDIFVDEETKEKSDDIFLDLPFSIDDTAKDKENDDKNIKISLEGQVKSVDDKSNKESDDIFLDLPFSLDDTAKDKEDDDKSSQLSSIGENDFTVNSVPIDNSQATMQLFQEVKPFEDVSLFDDRYDDGTVFKDDGLKIDLSNLQQVNNSFLDNIRDDKNEDSTKFSDSMPDVFWTTKEDTNNSSDDKVSFDKQIEALVESENKPDSKVKKLVS